MLKKIGELLFGLSTEKERLPLPSLFNFLEIKEHYLQGLCLSFKDNYWSIFVEVYC